ncbi:MAG: cell division protein FtsA [Acidobacteria bacterium]|nr:MAG: cell division protein FtsA [Acidobacteriota bacterium]
MNDDRPLVGIDVGSSTVKVVVAVPEPHRLVVKGCGEARHDGARKGIIANLEEVTAAVRVATEQAEAMASFPVTHAVVALGGAPVVGKKSCASTPVTGRNLTVSNGDVNLALSRCAAVMIPEDYRVLDIIACGYALDGQPGIENPEGMAGRTLEASAFVLFTTRAHFDSLEQSINQASVAVTSLQYEPLAAAEAVLSPDEKELGCMLIDIGHATSEWVVWSEGMVQASGTYPIGGRHFVADIATVMKTNTAGAELIKRSVGVSLDRHDLDLLGIEVPTLGGNGNQIADGRLAAQILYERAHELFVGIAKNLSELGMDRTPRAGVILTGGGARLEGMDGVAETIFAHHARIGMPRNLAGEVEPVAGPEWAVACGLIRLAHKKKQGPMERKQLEGGIFNRLRSVLGEIFEFGGGNDLH